MNNSKNKIIFLGTGGGGSMVNHQIFSTAGMWLTLNDTNFYLDPGPGAQWHIRHFSKAKLDPYNLDAIFVSHRHLDHSSDLNVVSESMVFNSKLMKYEKRGSVFLPHDGLDKNEGLIIDRFHQKLVKEVVTIEPEKEYQIKDITITTSKRLLEKPYYKERLDEYGFWFRGYDVDFGYLPETTYRTGLLDNFHPKILVANLCYFDREVKNSFILLMDIAKAVKPKTIIIRHWTRRAIDYGIEKIVKTVHEKTGIKTVAVTDGMIFDL